MPTVNPRISPLGAYLFLTLLEGGLFEGGLIKLSEIWHIKNSFLRFRFFS